MNKGTIFLLLSLCAIALAQPNQPITINATHINGGTPNLCLKVNTNGSLGQGSCGAAAVTPGGLTTAVQFNLAGAFGGDAANFAWNNTTKAFSVGTTPDATFKFLVYGRDVTAGNDAATSVGFNVVQAGNTRFYLNSNSPTGTLVALGRYSDLGAFIDNYWYGTRSSGQFNFVHAVQFDSLASLGTGCASLDNSGQIGFVAGICGTTKIYGGGFLNGGSAIAATTLSLPVTAPSACTITAWDISIPKADTGTATVKFLKIATGTASPDITNSISTSGVSLSSGTHVRSTTLSDFTTLAVSAGDIIAVALTTVGGSPTGLSANVECQ